MLADEAVAPETASALVAEQQHGAMAAPTEWATADSKQKTAMMLLNRFIVEC